VADPSILHWIAEAQGRVVGHMSCHQIRKRTGDRAEVLLYEIGVRTAHRRRGVGRALIETLTLWMTEHGISESWVLADNPEAVEFYRACGFETGKGIAVYMTRSR
jgi:GNAT superfamily N-acetyltransferase